MKGGSAYAPSPVEAPVRPAAVSEIGRLLRGSGYMLVGRAVNAACLFVLVLAVTRVLGPEGFGGYAFIHAVVTTGAVMACFGLDPLMVRELTSGQGEDRIVVGAALGAKLVTSAGVVVVCALVLTPLVPSGPVRLLMLLSLAAVVFNALSQTFWHYGSAQQRFGYHAALWAGLNLLKLACGGTALALGGGLAALIGALVAAEALTTAGSYALVRRRLGLRIVRVTGEQVAAMLHRAIPLGAIFVVNALYFRVDTLMLELLHGERAVGIFGAAHKLVELSGVVPGSLAIVFLPGLSRDHQVAPSAFRRRSGGSLVAVAGAGLAAGAFCWALAPQIVFRLYGADFGDAAGSLRILSAGIAPYFVNTYLVYVAIAAHREKLICGILGAAVALKMGLVCWLAPVHGSSGAATATVAAEFAAALAMLLFFVAPMFAGGERGPEGDPASLGTPL